MQNILVLPKLPATWDEKVLTANAQERLAKHDKNIKENRRPVRKVTCAEAVILYYQLTLYPVVNGPYWIALDGQYSTPTDLVEYVTANKWTKVQCA